MTDYARIHLGDVDFRAISATEGWTPGHVILGGLAIVKFMHPADGSTGFQICRTMDDTNIAERWGIASILETWAAEEVTAQMYPDD